MQFRLCSGLWYRGMGVAPPWLCSKLRCRGMGVALVMFRVVV